MNNKTIHFLKEEIKLLQKISETISYTLDLEQVLAEIVALVSKTMDADSCLIYLAQENSLVMKASKIPHPNMINKVVMKFGEGITGWAAAKKEIVIINEKSYSDKRNLIIKNLPEDKWEAFVSMPIIYKNEVVGVINVQHRKKKKYHSEEIDLLKTIASQVGGAITNARLITETRILKDALETRKIIERAKGLLMKQKNLNEEESYALIQKKSMDTKKSMKEVAEAILLAFNL